MIRLLWFNLFILLFTFTHSFNVNYFDDSVLFSLSTENRDVLDYRLGAKDHRELIPIVSADDEKYFCMIPEITTKEKNPIIDYTGPTPSELLTSIYNEQFCSLRTEPYWRYELCHGKYLRQYHDDKDAKITAEFYLGSYPKDKNEATPEFDFAKPPVKDIDGKLVPYFPVNYILGTHCDLNGKPRTTTVMYICSQDQPRSFISISEIKSCVYEAVIAVKELCSHPAFKKDEPIEHKIQCFASEKMDNPMPKSMLRFQNEIKARPMLPLKSNKGPLTQRVPSQYINNEVYELFKNPDTLKQIKELKNLINSVKNTKPSESDENLLASFWNGKACLYGGTSYWRYEYCYNSKVSQYHEEPDGKTTKINLGYYNPKLHEEWVAESKIDPRRIDGGRVLQVSNMYTRGDLCAEANTLRRCEVKLKCLEKAEDNNDPTAINMYLVEPEKCSYVLLIESTLICDKIQTADELGLLPAEKSDEEKEAESDAKIKF